MSLQVQVGPSVVTINRDDRILVCQPDARIVDGVEGVTAFFLNAEKGQVVFI